jgi:ankyrin repeat protein
MSTECGFTASRKDNLRQHCLKIHKLVPGTQLTIADDQKELETSKHMIVPEGALSPKPANRSHGDQHLWTSKLFLQAATTGNLAVVAASLDDGIDVNLRADDGSSALHCAARAGHIDVVQVLLQANSDIGVENLKRRSPLHEALLSQSLGIVKLLLRRGACLDPSSVVTKNCLAWSGHPEILKACLDHLSTKPPKHFMYSILIAASRDGQDSSVKALLPLFGGSSTGSGSMKREFNFVDWEHYRYSQVPGVTQVVPSHRLTRFTPLQVAAAKGHLCIIQTLVNHGADISQGFKGITALHMASQYGHVEVVRYLISLPEVKVNCERDGDGDTPLHRAAAYGKVDVLKLLLNHPDVDVNSSTSMKRTPLHEASSSGYLQVVELLLKHPDVDVNSPTSMKRTPLHEASSSGYLQVVELLLKHPDVDVNSPTSMKRTPLLEASSSGHLQVVELLLSHPDIDMKPLTDNGETPLHAASSSGYLRVVELLLQDQRTNAILKDSTGHTPLQYAACGGHLRTVEALLNHEHVEAAPKKAQIIQGGSVNPLQVLKRLLAHQDFRDIDVNVTVKVGYHEIGSLLKAMIREGHGDCVQLLLNHPNIDVNLTDGVWDDPPLIVASRTGNIEMVNLLLQHKDIDVNKESCQEGTPLLTASLTGDIEIVKLLLQHKDIDINKETGWDLTALQTARTIGHANVVHLLLEHGATDHDVSTTPLGSPGVENANSHAVPEPHLEEVSDNELEIQPYSFLDECMEDLDGSEALDEGTTTWMNTVLASDGDG